MAKRFEKAKYYNKKYGHLLANANIVETQL